MDSKNMYEKMRVSTRRDIIFYEYRKQLDKLLHLHFVYFIEKRDEEYGEVTEEIISTIDVLQQLLQPVDKHAEVVSSYFE